MTPQGISLRPATPEDYGFIYSTWLKALYYGWACKCTPKGPCCGSRGLFNLIPYPTYRVQYRRVLEGILARNRATVACLTEDPEVVLGYIVYGQAPTVHFVYVKKAWRKMGIAKTLWLPGTKQVSHLTKVGKQLLPENVIYNPFEI
jgi:hypothetical protein